MAELQTITSATDTGRVMADNEDRKIRATINNKSPNTLSGGTVFSDATKGLSLDTSRALTLTDAYANGGITYQNGIDSEYDVAPDPSQLQFLDALNNDTKNKLIGSLPKIGANAKMTTVQPKAEQPNMLKTITGEAGKAVGDTLTALENTAVTDYQNDLTNWVSQGKYWFDPNSELKPDLDKYLDNMPSAVDALRNSAFNKAFHGRTDTAPDAATTFLAPMINPAAVHNKNQAVSTLMNPLNLADRAAGKGFAGYVSSQAIKGAAGGLTGGPKGIAAGAIVGVVKGIFTWFAAKAEDAANAKKAQEAYELSLREWTLKRNQRLIAEKEADFKNRQIAEAEYTVIEDNKKEKAEAKKLQRIGEGRAMLKNVLMNAGKGGQAYRDRRAAAKATRRV